MATSSGTRIISVFVNVPRAVRAVTGARTCGAIAAEVAPPAAGVAACSSEGTLAPCPSTGTSAGMSTSSGAAAAAAAAVGQHSASYDDAGRLLLCLDSRQFTRLDIHLSDQQGPLMGAVRSQMLRPSHRVGSSAHPWVLPFLFGSGLTAALGVGLVAYNNQALNTRPRSPERLQQQAQQQRLQTRQLSMPGAAPGTAGPHNWLWSRWRAVADSTDVALSSPSAAAAAAHPPAHWPPSLSDERIMPTWGDSGCSLGGGGGGADGVSAMMTAAAAAARARSSPMTRASISEASAKAAPAVVHLVVTTRGREDSVHGHKHSGSGFIYDPAGWILTNAHVVADVGDEEHVLAVTLQDGRVRFGTVHRVDKAADVAVIKIDNDEPLPAARLGRSAHLAVGEWVVALGSPLMLKHSATAGIISCVERRGSELGLSAAPTGYIQTDAPSNVGNSGGPLINLDGEVIGMNNMKAVAADGVSFAIPIDTIQDIVRQLAQYGYVSRPFVGVTLKERVDGPHGDPTDKTPKVEISRVVTGSPADEAGLQQGDVVLAVAGETELTMAQMIERFTTHIGKPMELRLGRIVAKGSAAGATAVDDGTLGGRTECGAFERVHLVRTLTPVQASTAP